MIGLPEDQIDKTDMECEPEVVGIVVAIQPYADGYRIHIPESEYWELLSERLFEDDGIKSVADKPQIDGRWIIECYSPENDDELTELLAHIQNWFDWFALIPESEAGEDARDAMRRFERKYDPYDGEWRERYAKDHTMS